MNGIYNDMNNPITKAKWLTTVKSMKNKSTLGISNISYRLIKKGLTELYRLLIILANFCLKFGIISDQWKVTSLYPILKSYDWNFSITSTRSIILIECT